MRTFPDAEPGIPDIAGPWRYLLWIAGTVRRPLILDCVFNTFWVAGQGLTPAAIGEAINAGLIGRNQSALIWWGTAVLGLGIVQAVAALMAERCEVTVRVGGGYRTMQLVTRQACELGATVSERVSAGDLVTVGVSDINLIGQALETSGRGVGGVAAVAIVAALMLASSWQVGLMVLVAVPVILLITTRLSRLLRQRQGQVRARQRELADQAVDIVRGLRVLRGFGGEQLFAGRYREGSQRLRLAALRQAGASALLGAASTLLPGLLLAGVVALSGELVLDGHLNAGQMVAFYGYAAYLVLPLNRMTYAVSKAMQAHVAAENVVRLLRLRPEIEPPGDPAPMPGGPGTLADPESGLTVPAGQLTAVVCDAGDAARLADRLGRYTDSAATYDGRPLASLPLAGVREAILVAPGNAHIFAGPLRSELDPCGHPDRLPDAVDAAAARDIIEALPDQLDTSVAAGGQEFSGGQQQRLRLVRALMADPEVLILIDPTSAVDANTEAMMAAGITRLRRGRATLVFTTSILLLSRADNVALVVGGEAVAQGTHESLMTDARYRSLVERGMVAT